MPITQAELDNFHHFATQKIIQGGSSLTWDELFVLWESRNQRTEINHAIRRGLADVEAGNYRSAFEVLHELQNEVGSQDQ